MENASFATYILLMQPQVFLIVSEIILSVLRTSVSSLKFNQLYRQ